MNSHSPLTLDRVMISVPLEAVTTVNESSFLVHSTSSGGILSRYYSSKRTDLPYWLSIKVDHRKNVVIIDVSSKCLMDRYHELINTDTIGTVLKAINELGIVELDIVRVMKDAMVLSCDVTQDRYETLSPQRIEIMRLSLIKANWNPIPYQTGILFVKRGPKGRSSGQSLTLYDKHTEMLKSNNKRFRDSVKNPSLLLDQFVGKTRYELKLTTKKAVKGTLCVGDNRLETVLNASINAIDRVITQLFDTEEIERNNTLVDALGLHQTNKGKKAIDAYKNYLLCKECNYDLDKVKLILRQLLSHTTSLTVAISPYRQIIINRARGQ